MPCVCMYGIYGNNCVLPSRDKLCWHEIRFLKHNKTIGLANCFGIKKKRNNNNSNNARSNCTSKSLRIQMFFYQKKKKKKKKGKKRKKNSRYFIKCMIIFMYRLAINIMKREERPWRYHETIIHSDSTLGW